MGTGYHVLSEALLVALLAISSSTARAEPRHVKNSLDECVVMERPKHTIRKCRCDAGALSGVASIDAAEIVRLLIGSPACQAPGGHRK